jgi:hypothetical protein
VRLNGSEGVVRIKGDISKVSSFCLYDVMTRAIISDVITRIVEDYVGSIYCDEFKKLLKENGINDVVYLPSGRALLTLHRLITEEIKKRSELILSLDHNFTIADQYYITEFYRRLGNYDKKIYRILKPLLKGKIETEDGRLVYVQNGKAIPWEYVSSSILEIVSLLLSVKEGDLILYEEPEAHLHEELQLLMGIALYALSSSNRIVLSTHSQTVFYTLAHLSILKPTKEELNELFQDLGVKGYEALLRAVEKANRKDVKVKIYYFDDKGKVKEIDVEEATRGMLGTIDVLEKGLKWTSSLHSKRLFG